MYLRRVTAVEPGLSALASTDIYWQDPAFLTFFKLLRQRWYLG